MTAGLAELRDAASWVARAAGREHHPIEMSGGPGGLTLACGLAFHRKVITIDYEGGPIEAVVPSALFASWLETQTGKSVVLTSDDKVRAKARGTVTLPKLAMPDRAAPPQPRPWLEVDADVIHEAITAASAHGGRRDALPYELSFGVSPAMIFGGSPYGAAVTRLGGPEEQAVQVDREQLRGAVAGAQGSVELLRADWSLMWVRHGDRETQMGLQDYVMPDFAKVTAMPTSKRLEADAAEFRSAVRGASFETDVVQIDAADGRLEVQSLRSTREKQVLASGIDGVDCSGDDLTARFNAPWLSAVLATLTGDVQVTWTPDRGPYHLTDGRGAHHVLMPIKGDT